MSIIANAKEVAELVKKLGDIELYRKIVELEGEIIELTREKRELEDELEKAKFLLETSHDMKWKQPFYFVEGDTIPYCARCWEAEKIQVHLTKTGTISYPWKCPKCDTAYDTTQ